MGPDTKLILSLVNRITVRVSSWDLSVILLLTILLLVYSYRATVVKN